MALGPPLETIEQRLEVEDGRVVARFKGLRLESAFQPVFGIGQGRPAGHEGLLRAADIHGTPVPPHQVFRLASTPGEGVLLDCLCRAIHARNFARLAPGKSWLFLNLSSLSFAAQMRGYQDAFPGLLAGAGVPAHQVVVEVLESALQKDEDAVKSIAFYRETGCLVAVDDFGAGHSNIDRVWRLKPDIVKLDRVLIQHAALDRIAQRFFKRLVSGMHEAGALVVVEGIETQGEAIIAMDSDADFVQGFYFARPAAVLCTGSDQRQTFDDLYHLFRRMTLLEQKGYRTGIFPYRKAFEWAAQQRQAGASLKAAARQFLGLPYSERCYVLGETGHQAGESLLSPTSPLASDNRFQPVSPDKGSYWGYRHYFRRAVANAGNVSVTRPYLSLPTGARCITLSIAVTVAGAVEVLCADIQADELLSSDMTMP
jgi:EAL domain-containing protein (putative c-di-GMP-specific phosphodiesterase class I)